MSLKDCSVDIIIPSLRPDNIKALVNELDNHQTECKVKIITDTETVGLYKAVNKMVESSDSEFIIHIPDDVSIVDGWVDALIQCLLDNPEHTIASSRTLIYKHEATYHGYYGYPFAAFPCVRRSLIEKLGTFFDPNLNCFYGDPDLSMRIWMSGGRLVLCEDAWIHFASKHDGLKQSNLANHMNEDEEYFKEKWKPLGKFTKQDMKYADLMERLNG